MTSLAEKTTLVRDYSQRYLMDRWFIGTGGSNGEDLWNLRTDFDRLISINPDYDDYTGSQLRFLDSPHVIIVDGDSYYWIPQLLNTIDESIFFWLEGEYALSELEQILRKQRDNVILLEVPDEDTFDKAIVLLAEAMGFGYPASDYIRVGTVVCIVPRTEDFEAEVV